jgi:hypothetical protein
MVSLFDSPWRTFGKAVDLARLGLVMSSGPHAQYFGVELDDATGLKMPGVDVESIPARIMSFLLHLVEARFWNYAWRQWAYPGAFAGLLDGGVNQQKAASFAARKLWKVATDVESKGKVNHGMASLRNKIFWLSWPAWCLIVHCNAETLNP